MTTFAAEVARLRTHSGANIIITSDGRDFFGQFGQAQAVAVGPCSGGEILDWALSRVEIALSSALGHAETTGVWLEGGVLQC